MCLPGVCTEGLCAPNSHYHSHSFWGFRKIFEHFVGLRIPSYMNIPHHQFRGKGLFFNPIYLSIPRAPTFFRISS